MTTPQELADEIYINMTGPGSDPMRASDREALRCGLNIGVMFLGSLMRIADACERSAAAAEGVRPAHDGLTGL